MNKLTLTLAAALCSILAFAQTVPGGEIPITGPDHLVPIPSAFDMSLLDDDYSKIVATVFKEAFDRNVRARVYITAAGPGAILSDMLFLKETDKDYRVVFLHAGVPLWMYRSQIVRSKMHFPLNPPDYHNIGPQRCETSIPQPLGKRIVELWKKALLETRYETKRNRGMDGADYTFSMEIQFEDFQEDQPLTGTTWSPDERTKPGMLATIAYAMQIKCTQEPTSEMEPLETLVQKLEAKFVGGP